MTNYVLFSNASSNDAPNSTGNTCSIATEDVDVNKIYKKSKSILLLTFWNNFSVLAYVAVVVLILHAVIAMQTILSDMTNTVIFICQINLQYLTLTIKFAKSTPNTLM